MLALYLLPLTSLALPATLAHDAHNHWSRGAVPSLWHRSLSDPLGDLFKRADSATSPTPGSDAWKKLYPGDLPPYDEADINPRWVAAYKAAKAANLIPDIPLASDATGPVTYPAGVDRNSTAVCSADVVFCRADGDIWEAPPGHLGINFDDGPLIASADLYTFLHQHNIPSTHFMIGRVIREFVPTFQQAFTTNRAAIAVHTWSHPLLSTLTDLQIVSELGWTMQIIYDLTDGRVPKFWRPPRGVADNRVRAIATHVFGMSMIMWNKDTEDWQMNSTPGFQSQWIPGNLSIWLSGPQTTGLIILQHELTPNHTAFFMNTTYPLAVKYNWTMGNVPDLVGADWYLNAHDDTGAPANMTIGLDVSTLSKTTGGAVTVAVSLHAIAGLLGLLAFVAVC